MNIELIPAKMKIVETIIAPEKINIVLTIDEAEKLNTIMRNINGSGTLRNFSDELAINLTKSLGHNSPYYVSKYANSVRTPMHLND